MNLLKNFGVLTLSAIVLMCSQESSIAALFTTSGTFSGQINGISINGMTMDGSADTDTGDIVAELSGVPTELLAVQKWSFIHIIFNSSPVFAMEMGAPNLLSITGGNINQDINTVFSTGEQMNVSRSMSLVGNNLVSSSVYDGDLPGIPDGSNLEALDFVDLYTQISPTTIRAVSNRPYLLDGNLVTGNAITDFTYSGLNQLPSQQRLIGTNLVFSDLGNNQVRFEMTAVMKPVPEPTATISLLSLGILGAGATLKRKLKHSNSIEKETTKVG